MDREREDVPLALHNERMERPCKARKVRRSGLRFKASRSRFSASQVRSN